MFWICEVFFMDILVINISSMQRPFEPSNKITPFLLKAKVQAYRPLSGHWRISSEMFLLKVSPGHTVEDNSDFKLN